MIKRPLCLVAAVFLIMLTILTGGFGIAKDLKPSPLEKCAAEGENVTLTGKVFRREERREYQVYYLADCLVRLKEQIIKESKLLVYVKHENPDTDNYKTDDVQKKAAVGNRIRASGSVQFFVKARNPGNFDQKFYWQKQGIHAQVWVDTAEITDHTTDRIKEFLTILRIRLKEKLIKCLGEHYGNCMSAILLGDKSGLPDEVKELYQKSGIGHILAISGLHMSFLGIGFYSLTRKSGFSFAAAGTAGAVFLILYTLMTGVGVSSLRALVMFLVRIGADITGRSYDMPTALSLAAAVTVLWQPLYLFDAGFLLSFGAVLGLIILTPLLEAYQVLPGFLCAGISVHILLIPVLLYYYFEIPLYSVLLNLAVVPLMSLVLGFGAAGVFFLVFSQTLGGSVLQICRWILWGYERLCTISLELPFGRLVLGQPEKVLIAGYYFLLAADCFYGFWHLKICRKQKKTACPGKKLSRDRFSLFFACGIFILPAVFCVLCWCGQGKKGEMQVVFLDVGQGDGIYIRTPDGSHWMIDGGSSDVKEAGKYRIEPYLKSKGAASLEYVFLSHGDEDHINGVRELLLNQERGIVVETLVLPPVSVLEESLLELAELAFAKGTKVVTIKEGGQIIEGELELSCLAPGDTYRGGAGNAASMVLQLSYRKFDLLLTGDVEGEGETALTKSRLLKDCDVLKVAHHGSKNSTKEEFLQKANPEIAVISAGIDNRYGHPHKETLERLMKAGCVILNTQDNGAVSLKTDGEKIWIDR